MVHFPSKCGFGTERVAYHLLALAIDRADVRSLNLTEMMLLFNALVNANEKKNAVILRREGIQPHDDLLIVIGSRAALPFVTAVG